MDELAQYLALKDGVTAPLRSMRDAADALYESQEAVAQSMERMEDGMGGIGTAASKAGGVMASLSSGMKSMVGQFAVGNIAANLFMRAADFLTELPGRIVSASDAYAGMVARLNLVTGSEKEAAEMNDLIYQSALRARGSYDGMADSVSKIAMTAKDAFPDPRQVVPFVEGIQKLFTIGGTGIQQQADAMLQLTQALGSGKLQGDEFRSIAEAAPLIEQMVAKHMGIAQGELKQLSSQGVITADILRDAILENMDEINADFAKMPLTWGQAWQQMGTITTRAMVPVYDALRGIINGGALNGFISSFSMIMPVVGRVLGGMIQAVSEAAGGIGAVFSYLADWASAAFLLIGSAFEQVYPVIIGGLAGWAAYLAIVNGHLVIEATVQAASAAMTTVAAAAKAAWTAATNLQVVAAAALNAVLNANPIMWVARLALFAVAAFVAWQAGTMGLRNTIAEAFRTIADIAGAVINFVIARINTLIRFIDAAAAGLNRLTGSHIEAIGTIEWKAEGWGDKAYDAVQNFDPAKALASLTQAPDVSSGGVPADYGGYGVPAGGIGEDAEGPAAKETASNTKGILDAMDIMDEDIKFFRDAAEQEVINRYTTASVQIHLENTNNITNDVDAEGMITHLIDQLEEAELAGAEAVHI